ncbi:lipase family protein [Nocardia mangyaensis]|uniref:lipase family protein n=1 Tax=Nocardia mangyaensis TaxID=2213200 RepID=UPI0026767C29|nr:lipase family protein [Nocardia mangyaensis]MDO3646501.1 lipase family protein [Nocardia mangyaensis]
MRSVRVLVCSLLLLCSFAVGNAAADPPPPELPGVPGFLPDLQRWIDQVLPSPIQPTDAESGDPAAELAALRAAVLPSPVGDPIFDHWPEGLASLAPGELIETRDITGVAGLLTLVPIRSATLLKYRTADAHGRPSFATATLIVPATDWTGPGDRPVLVNNLPIDALGRKCTPGYTLTHGLSTQSSMTEFLPPTTQLAVLRGYAVLVPDHQGPWMAYAEPYVAGHAVLDAIRAVRGSDPGTYGKSRVAMTGYSGGAIATHGAAKLIEPYAPELAEVIVGAALGGVPADFEILARSMNGNLASGIFMAATFAIGRERPEILAAMNNLARWVATSPMKDQCVSVFAVPGVLHLPIDVGANIADPLRSELATQIYEITRMAGLRSATPLYIYNGEQEWWIPAEGARNLYAEQCALGANAVYRGVFGEHIVGAVTGYPEAMLWLDERLQGVAARSEC